MRGQARKEEKTVDSVVKALTVDHTLSGVLNVAKYEHDLEVTPEG